MNCFLCGKHAVPLQSAFAATFSAQVQEIHGRGMCGYCILAWLYEARLDRQTSYPESVEEITLSINELTLEMISLRTGSFLAGKCC